MKTAFVWNAGAWFGSQLGGSAWALLLGISLLFEDIPAALVFLGGFVAFNVYGLYLWRRRDRLSAYGGIVRLQCAFLALCLIAITIVNLRGLGETPSRPGATTTPIPYGMLAVLVVFMLWSFLRERAARRGSA